MKLRKKICIAVGLIALAACESASTAGNPAFSDADEARRTFAADSGNVDAAFDAGEVLSSRAGTATGIQLRFNGGSTNLADAEVSVSKNADGELTATLNGESREFEVTDRLIEPNGDSFGYTFTAADGASFNLFHFGGTLEELIESDDFGTIVSVGADLGPENDTLFNRAFAAIGTETTDAALGELDQSVTFTGNGRLDLYPTENFIDTGTSRSRLRGDTVFTADFAAGEISGTMSDLTLQMAGASDRDDIAGQIDFATAGFSANTFSGDVSGTSDLATAGVTLNDDVSYNGAFFGPNAEEVHGVINGTGSLNGEAFNTIGYFTQ